jgi:hypothetical protein
MQSHGLDHASVPQPEDTRLTIDEDRIIVESSFEMEPFTVYRRCPECLDRQTRTPCSWCAGTGFVPTSLTLEDREHLLSQIRELRAAARSLSIAVEEHRYLGPQAGNGLH